MFCRCYVNKPGLSHKYPCISEKLKHCGALLALLLFERSVSNDFFKITVFLDSGFSFILFFSLSPSNVLHCLYLKALHHIPYF